jgi:predicted enzyme related to lactoylglutathione lyase
MPYRDTPWPAGTPCWVDLAVPDVSVATAFYGAVLGWSFVDSGERYGHFHLAYSGDRAAAAIGPAPQSGRPPVWTVYLATEDAGATAELITGAGGSVLAGPAEVAGGARMAIALDPTGAAFGVWQAGGMIGAEVVAEPGALAWTDVRSSHPAADEDFYSAVFGYTYQPVPGAPAGYATIHIGNGDPVAGLVGAPDGVPSHWLSYFAVDDVDRAVAIAARGGAEVLLPAEETGSGRIGILTDPFGATFALHRTPDED